MMRRVKALQPDLIADVTFYAAEVGGKTVPIFSGYGCPCMVSQVEPLQGWDARLVFDDDPIFPGQRRRVGLTFLTREGARSIGEARHFFLWEGRFVGEADVCEGEADLPSPSKN
jgi:hypothetical protein